MKSREYYNTLSKINVQKGSLVYLSSWQYCAA